MGKILAKRFVTKDKSLAIVGGDIFEFVGDALLNPTNPEMVMNNDVGRKITRMEMQSGSSLHVGGTQWACAQWIAKHGEISQEKPAFTMTESLPFQTIIHTVYPPFRSSLEEQSKLWHTIRKALDLADLLMLHSIGIPPIPNWPVTTAANILIFGCVDYLRTRDSSIFTITLLVNNDAASQSYAQLLEDYPTSW
ncbi:MAG: macro domain-containing protein [Anaerolineae bacterium]|nr:macro domain-containing protein [Anaerolineae bacterium]